ncbi:hypothetical protein [Pedobacter sp. Hv1]|nr:hypothetical protein [Pedobacter sp. Hv1]
MEQLIIDSRLLNRWKGEIPIIYKDTIAVKKKMFWGLTTHS